MINPKTALVVTSIAAPNDVLRSLAAGSTTHGVHFVMIGDVPSPKDFQLDGCDFFSLDRQAQTGLRTAELVPKRHYARKNIGYLLAAREGSELIIETDDDNFPRDGFWAERTRVQSSATLSQQSWVNVYRYFSDALIWPRGLPLDEVQTEPTPFENLPVSEADCPIQQGLADDNPDVDAIYRLLLPLPLSFRSDRRVALASTSWCPFNSQNTTFWRDAFPLLYLPAYCSFRMTDIWRSFVAQRIGWENGWSILFHEATVSQLRNDHSLMRDFADEVPGYLHNRKIGEVLMGLTLEAGVEHLGANLLACYEALVSAAIMDQKEIPLVEAWLADLK
jgi:hypothetical protein